MPQELSENENEPSEFANLLGALNAAELEHFLKLAAQEMGSGKQKEDAPAAFVGPPRWKAGERVKYIVHREYTCTVVSCHGDKTVTLAVDGYENCTTLADCDEVTPL